MPHFTRVITPVFLLLIASLGIVQALEILGEVRSRHEMGRGDSYVYVGDLLQLTCSLNSSVSWQATDLTFTLENDFYNSSYVLPEEEVSVVNSSTAQLRHRVDGEQDAGEYFCWVDTAGDDLLVNSQQVYVQYRPRGVSGFYCEVKDWDENINCSWEYGVNYINHSDVSVSVHLMVSAWFGTPCSQRVSALDRRSQCVWSGDQFRAAAQYILVVNVTNEVTKDWNMTYHTIITKKIIKPSPVSHVRRTDVNSSCIAVAWYHTRVHRHMVFRVNVTSGGGSELVYKKSVELCGLLPYTAYTVSVECRPLDTSNSNTPLGFWSEAVDITVTTAQSAPISSFQVHRGGYLLGPCKDGTRDVTLFLKGVPARERNGKIVGYQLVYNGSSHTVDRPSPTTALLHNVTCGAEFPVQIYSRTVAGRSRTNAMLYVSAEDADPVAELAVEMLDGGGVRVVWSNASNDNDDSDNDDDMNITVFRCLKDRETLDRTCKEHEEIEWTNIPFSAGGVDFARQSASGREASTQDFLFGVSRGGQPLQWADCYYRPHARMAAPELWVKGMDGGLEVEWSLRQCTESYPVHTTAVRLYYCRQGRCPQGREVEVKVDRGQRFIIHGEPGTSYNVSARSVDFSGRLSPLSASHVQAVLMAADGFSRSWVLWAVATVMLLAVLVCLVSLYWCLKKYFRKRAKFAPAYRFERQGNYQGQPASPPHQVLFSSPIMDSDMEDTSCRTTLTEVFSGGGDSQGWGDGSGGGHLSEGLAAPWTQHREGPAPPLASAAHESSASEAPPIPMTDLGTGRGTATGAGAERGEAGQSPVLSAAMLLVPEKEEGFTACSTQSPSVVGGRGCGGYTPRLDSFPRDSLAPSQNTFPQKNNANCPYSPRPDMDISTPSQNTFLQKNNANSPYSPRPDAAVLWETSKPGGLQSVAVSYPAWVDQSQRRSLGEVNGSYVPSSSGCSTRESNDTLPAAVSHPYVVGCDGDAAARLVNRRGKDSPYVPQLDSCSPAGLQNMPVGGDDDDPFSEDSLSWGSVPSLVGDEVGEDAI
ncbi:uncharacterized protein LOC143294533 [Babylonia areolata]|uniref:uncharacterized protein LOC143294533 n=1 Tax=Babylonia areolata TaxID=304850 RepID=UPI003FCFF82D